MPEIFGFDAFSPAEIAERIENIGVNKAKLPFLSIIMLGILAGAFIALGALFYVVVISDHSLNFALSRVLGGFVFSLGLVMVVIAGAELFTGNNLLVMAWADQKISSYELLRNWLLVSVSNFFGAIGIVLLVFFSNHLNMNDGALRESYLQIARTKCAIPWPQAYFSGILCNIFVCLAVWMSQAGRSVVDKVIVIVFPVSAFVASGFEHSIANMYFIPMGLFIQGFGNSTSSAMVLSISGMFGNLIPVILGNLTGGVVFVSMFYHFIYKRKVKSV